MEFKSLKNIETSFRQIRLFGIVFLALYTFGKAVYDIGRNDGRRIEINHIERLELPAQPTKNKNAMKYGRTEE